MITVYDVDSFMSGWASKELSEPWDNDGVMLCADMKSEVKKILVCLEINEKTVNEAIDEKADLIITHHPFIFHPLKNITGAECNVIGKLFSANISVLSYHTRLDAAVGGVNDVLAKALGLSHIEGFASLGRVGILDREMDEKEFALYVKQKLACSTVKTSKPVGKKIKRVAVVGGAGKDFLPQALGIADAYVTGDLSHNAFITANEIGIFAVDAGHYHTENPVTHEIAEKLKDEFSEAEIVVSDSLCPFCEF